MFRDLQAGRRIRLRLRPGRRGARTRPHVRRGRPAGAQGRAPGRSAAVLVSGSCPPTRDRSSTSRVRCCGVRSASCTSGSLRPRSAGRQRNRAADPAHRFALLAAEIAAAIVFSRVITRPLLKLAGAAETFGRGQASQPVSIASDDEVGELARVFNEMMESRMRAEEEQARLDRGAAADAGRSQDAARLSADLLLLQEDPQGRGLLAADRVLHQGALRGRVQPRHLPRLHEGALPGAVGQGQGKDGGVIGKRVEPKASG